MDNRRDIMSAQRKMRNSSVELLRIIAMYLIVASHYCLFALDTRTLPFGVSQVVLQCTLAAGGKVGVVVFFGITAWYLSDKGGLKASLRRIWMMEREMLFWSLALVTVSLVYRPDLVSTTTIATAFFPLASSIWWYPTAYAIFLVFFPFLGGGLKLIGQNAHRTLAIVMFVIWTCVAGFFPFEGLGFGGSFTSFIYLYVLITYYRWYMETWSVRQGWTCFGIGFAVNAVWTVIWDLIYRLTGYGAAIQSGLQGTEYKLPVMMMGFGLLVVFTQQQFSSRLINFIASSTFGVYLISEFPLVRTTLWNAVIWTRDLAATPLLIIYGIFIPLAVYLMCALFDFFRRGLFQLTIDRHVGQGFEKLWNRIVLKVGN